MAGSPEAAEAKMRILGKEVDPDHVAYAGFYLGLAGLWSINAPCIAIPALITGFGFIGYGAYGARKKEQPRLHNWEGRVID